MALKPVLRSNFCQLETFHCSPWRGPKTACACFARQVAAVEEALPIDGRCHRRDGTLHARRAIDRSWGADPDVIALAEPLAVLGVYLVGVAWVTQGCDLMRPEVTDPLLAAPKRWAAPGFH